MYYVTAMQSFSAAHSLRDYEGKCERLHGHNYRVEVTLKGPALTKNGMVVDFTLLRSALDKAISRLDHNYLNEVKPFDKINPTAEYISKLLYEEMVLKFSTQKVKVHEVVVWESDDCRASYGPK
jgi:6-pyruvoyltetrahydropterin/6-carboxytetrahydropterin synthase